MKYALRTLWKDRGFAAMAVLSLAIGIGANTAIFSFVNGVLLKPLPHGEPERIVRVLEKPPGGGRNGISTLNYLDWEKDNTVFEYLAAQTAGSVTLTGVNEPVQLRGSRVSPHYFDVFGIKATLGRTFAADEGHWEGSGWRCSATPCGIRSSAPIRKRSAAPLPWMAARTPSSASCRRAARSTGLTRKSGGRWLSSRRT